MTDGVMPEMKGRDLTRYGVLDEGVHFIQHTDTQNVLATKIREALD